MDLKSLDQQILQFLEKQNLIKKLDSRLAELKSHIESKNKEIDTKKAKMESEQSDVKRLENLSIKKLFTQLLGSTEEELAKERQEYLDAVYEYNGAVDELEAIQYEHKLLEEKSDKEANVDGVLKELISKKEAYLKTRPDAISRTIQGFDREVFVLKKELTEIMEAFDAGKSSIEAMVELFNGLHQIHSYMNRPSNQRGIFSNIRIKELLERSTRIAGATQTRLNLYERELADVFSNYNTNFRLDSFQDFMTQFYKFFVMEWVKRRSLEQVLHDIQEIKQRTDSYQSELHRMKEARQSKMDELLENKRLYIIEA